MKNMTSLLLVDDSPAYSEMVQSMLQLEGRYVVDWVTTLGQMRENLSQKMYAAVLLDNHLPDGSGLEELSSLTSKASMPPVIMITGEGDEKIASEAIKLGAFDYLRKGKPELVELSHIVDRAIKMHADMLLKLEAEEKVRYHSLLLDRLADAVVVLDSGGCVNYWNEGAEELFGLSSEEAMNKFFRELVTDSREFHEFFESGSEMQVVQLSVHPDEELYVSVNSAEVRLLDQEATGRVYVFRDITLYRKLQDELRSTQRELLEAGRIASIGELASSLAHQIHNPLTTVLGEAQILARELEHGSPEQASATAIEEAGWRASEVIKHLMEITADVEDSGGRFDLVPTILTAVELCRPAQERQNVHLSMSLQPGLPKVTIQERDLIDLWFHLIQVSSECAARGNHARLYIATHLHDMAIEVKILCSGGFPEPETDKEKSESGLLGSGMAIIESILAKYPDGLSMEIHSGAESEVIVQIHLGEASHEKFNVDGRD